MVASQKRENIKKGIKLPKLLHEAPKSENNNNGKYFVHNSHFKLRPPSLKMVSIPIIFIEHFISLIAFLCLILNVISGI